MKIIIKVRILVLSRIQILGVRHLAFLLKSLTLPAILGVEFVFLSSIKFSMFVIIILSAFRIASSVLFASRSSRN